MKHKRTNFSKITPYIYIGTNFCCRVHFDKKLLKLGIKTDISLEDAKVDTPFGVKTYLWLPVKDYYAPTLYQLQMGADVIENAVQNKEKVYVHCKNGHGRAPSLVIGYLIHNGMKMKAAISLVEKGRPEIHLQKTQLSALKKFEAMYS